MNKKLKKVLKWGVYYPLLVIICLELALLILGYRRYIDEPYTVNAEPANAFVGNDSLGIALNPGKYTITLNEHIHFTTTHTVNHQRINPFKTADTLEKVAFLGCSFTYGYGVNDDETFVAELQKHNPNYTFENYGVVGYGTVQSYLQLPEILKDTAVKLVVLDFSSFHFMRNVLSQAYRRNLKIGYGNSAEKNNTLMQKARFPYLLDCSDSICYANWTTMHEDWAGRDIFATVNWIQTLTESMKDKKTDAIGITACLIDKMKTLCKEANVKFMVACLDQTEETIALKSKLSEINWVEVGFDFSAQDLTLLPYDSHPSAAGHHSIARIIQPYLTNLLRHD